MSENARSRGAPAGAGGGPVVVVGAGLVGLCSAYFLRKAGADVTVLERDRVGSGASRGNAGEICPSLADPLPAPGMVGDALRNLFRPDAAFFVRPSVAPRIAGYLLGFARHANRRAYERGLAAMAQLARMTYDLYDELAEAGIGADQSRDGYLFCCLSPKSARHHREGVEEMGRRGLACSPGALLFAGELAEREPALGDAVQAGFHLPGERWLNPSRFVDELASALRGMGVDIVEGARVTSIDERPSEVVVSSGAGRFRGSVAVVAGGVWSREVARMLGLRLSLEPGKGYSFSVRPKTIPRILLYLPDAHVAVLPLGDRIRIAGTMEFDGTYDRFNPRRIDAMVRAAGPYLRDVDWSDRFDEWVGPRPMTPDGLPMIGRFPRSSRVFMAAGHNMLGLTLSPATGKVIADLVVGGRADIDLAPFAVARLAR